MPGRRAGGGHEALLRWNHLQRGVLAPGAFLKVAEDSGLIEAIDRCMFQKALDSGRELVRAGGYVSLNASPRLFQQKESDLHLRALIAGSGFDPACLRLEATEGTLLETPMRWLQSCNGCAMPASIARSTTSARVFLARLRACLPASDDQDRPQLHQPILGRVSPRSSAIIEAVLELGKALGIEILAEGIETEYQRAILDGNGLRPRTRLFVRAARAGAPLAGAACSRQGLWRVRRSINADVNLRPRPL